MTAKRETGKHGDFGAVYIDKVNWRVAYWSHFRSDCEESADHYRLKGFNARIIRNAVSRQTGMVWAVAIRKKE